MSVAYRCIACYACRGSNPCRGATAESLFSAQGHIATGAGALLKKCLRQNLLAVLTRILFSSTRETPACGARFASVPFNRIPQLRASSPNIIAHANSTFKGTCRLLRRRKSNGFQWRSMRGSKWTTHRRRPRMPRSRLHPHYPDLSRRSS